MKTNKDYLDDFTGPFKQMLRNIGDFFRYGISDRVMDWVEDDERPRKKGCLWTVIKWYIIIAVIVNLFSQCGGENKEPKGDVISTTVPTIITGTSPESLPETVPTTQAPQSSEKKSLWEKFNIPDNIYDLALWAIRDSIDSILAEDSIDMEALYSEYETLHSLKTMEYLFKAYAYGNFTGEYDIERFSYILEDCEKIRDEMILYFPEEEVNADLEFFTVVSSRAFDDSSFDYDSMLVGSHENPDVDAMWINYVSAMTGNNGMDVDDLISAYSGPENVTPQFTEPFTVTDPIENNLSEETHIEGYVMYGTGGLNIRNGPGVSYEQIGRLPEGEQVIILETQYSGTADWGRIERGWICLDYIQFGYDSDYEAEMPVAEDICEMDFFVASLPDDWSEKYVLEHNYSVRSEYLVFYYKSGYEHYQYTYAEPGGWPFAIEIRNDGDAANAIAAWEPVGVITSYEGYTYNIFLHYPMDPQFMDAAYNEYLTDAHNIVRSIVPKDGYSITWFN